MTRIACAQLNVVFGNPEANLGTALGHIRDLAARRVDLVIFPEAFLTGYVVKTVAEAKGIALSGEDKSRILGDIQQAAKDHDIHVVIGYMEEEDGQIFNSATLFSPDRDAQRYRKTHLPFLGIDKFATPGNEIKVFETRLGKIGILICFDLRVPEACRELALQGADILVLPTNWPEGAERTPQHFVPVRAGENVYFVAACNRVGTENGVRFIGNSAIATPSMDILGFGGDGEEVLIADLDLSLSRSKTRVVIPGEYETDTFSTRQPGLYPSV